MKLEDLKKEQQIDSTPSIVKEEKKEQIYEQAKTINKTYKLNHPDKYMIPIRKSPDLDVTPYDSLPSGAAVFVVTESRGFYRTKTGSWVEKKYCLPIEE